MYTKILSDQIFYLFLSLPFQSCRIALRLRFCFLAVFATGQTCNQDFAEGEGLEPKVKIFLFEYCLIWTAVLSKLKLLKCITDRDSQVYPSRCSPWGLRPILWAISVIFQKKISILTLSDHISHVFGAMFKN